MRLNDLLEQLEQLDLTTCQYLGSKGIKFSKTKREDGTGADFMMPDSDTTLKAWSTIKKNKSLAKHFDYKLDSESNTIEVYFK